VKREEGRCDDQDKNVKEFPKIRENTEQVNRESIEDGRQKSGTESKFKCIDSSAFVFFSLLAVVSK
jgi:hypothetical protein